MTELLKGDCQERLDKCCQEDFQEPQLCMQKKGRWEGLPDGVFREKEKERKGRKGFFWEKRKRKQNTWVKTETKATI